MTGVQTCALPICVLEAAQVLVRSRTADVGDALAASVGTAVGVVVASRLFESGRRADIDRSGMPWAVLSLVCACALYAVYNLSPFDFTRPDDVNARVSALLQVPFSSYYEGPEFDGLWGALFKFGLGLPVGACTAWAARHVLAQYPRAAMAAAAVGWLVWFSVVEAGQVFLPSRYPDVTDILLAMCGAGVGLWSVGRVIAAPRH